MLQPALMMARKPESVGMPQGVSMLIQTEDKAVNGFTNNVDNSFSHPIASRTGRFKIWEAEPAPTIMATRKRGIQTRIITYSDCRKARRTQKAQRRVTKPGRDTSSEDQGATSQNGLAHHDTTMGMMGQYQVTSKSAMNVTPPGRGYMRSSLQRSCYVERQSGEGGKPVVLNPLALAYHFGRATSTPDGPDEMVQKISCDVHTGRNEAMSAPTPMGACPRVKRGVLSPARSRPSVITGRRPQTAVEDNGAESDGADNIISEGSTTPSFGEVRGGLFQGKKIETCTKWRKPLRFFFWKGQKN